jgi:hypothetical protein
MTLAMQIARQRAAGFAGWGDIDLGFPGDSGYPTDGGGDNGDWSVISTTTNAPRPNSGSGGPSVFGAQLPSLIGGGLQVLRDIFAPVGTSQAAYGSQRPTVQYQPQQQYATPPAGYGYDSSGRLVQQSASNVISFISNNFLLVGAGVLGVILLFRSPPGRR